MAKKEALEWLRFAFDDLDAAIYLMGMKKRSLEIICYHCQQCAEKSMKAIYAFHDLEIPRTHDSRVLVSGLKSLYSFSELDARLAFLQPFSVSARYPFQIEIITGDDESAVKAAKEIYIFCHDMIKGVN